MQTIAPSNNTTHCRFFLVGSQISICVSVLAGGGKKSRNDLVVVAEVDCCRVPYSSGCERGMAFHLVFFFSVFSPALFCVCRHTFGLYESCGRLLSYHGQSVSQSVSLKDHGMWLELKLTTLMLIRKVMKSSDLSLCPCFRSSYRQRE